MKLQYCIGAIGAVVVQAAYPGDIVQYWVDQTAILVNGTLIGGLQSPPSAWVPAIVQSAIYLAALETETKDLPVQQLAVSHAAHNSLQWAFHGTRNLAAVDASLKAVLTPIGLNGSSDIAKSAVKVGRRAAAYFVKSRADDGSNDFVDYVFGNASIPGVYQATPGGTPIPDTPEAQFVKPFILRSVSKFVAAVPAPPSLSDKSYQDYVLYVKAQGSRNSTVRSKYDTDTAYFWRESAPTVWNRAATAVIGKSLATNVTASAKFYAQLNLALANAGIAAWNVKFKYNAWRPVTAIHFSKIFLPSGLNVSDATWTPLLIPTPSHQDYVSTHSTFGGAGSAVIRAWNKGSDLVNATWSSNVTLDARGVITRTYTNLSAAAIENGESRVFGGLHFSFASGAGIALGKAVALETLAEFDEYWADISRR